MEIIEKQQSIRIGDLEYKSGIFIVDLFNLIEELIEEGKIECKRNGIFKYYSIT